MFALGGGMGMAMEVERHQSGRSEKVGGRRRPQQRPSFDPKRISFHRCYAYERTVCIRSTTLVEYMRIISLLHKIYRKHIRTSPLPDYTYQHIMDNLIRNFRWK